MKHWYEENVNGTIIGAQTSPYEFWSKDGTRKIWKGHFENDESAIADFKERFPAEFKEAWR